MNIIMIVSDQHRFCDLGYMGNKAVETPNLDYMAEHGIYMSSTYSPCPLCVPARGSIFTGCHALKHGAAANDLPVRPDAPSIARTLNEAGYMTAHVGKWHLGGVPRERAIPKEERLGFRYWRGCNCNHEYLDSWYDDNDNRRYRIEGYEPVKQTDLALEFLETYQETNQDSEYKNGFFLSLCFGPPHDPYDALPPGEKERFANKSFELRKNARNQKAEDFAIKGKDLKDLYAGYYAQISQLDIQIGRILDWVRVQGHAKDTIVIYTSDHGDMLGSHGFANKQLWYEESAHVPCVMWGGGLPVRRVDRTFSLVDIAPTIAGLCGVGMEAVDGRNLSGYLLKQGDGGESIEEEPDNYAYFYSYVPCHQATFRKVKSWRAITDGRYKLVVDDMHNLIALYDCLEDPLEERNLAGDSSIFADMTVKRLMEQLDRQVSLYDGYQPYLDLLHDHKLLDKWIESERYFTNAWTFVPAPLRWLKLRNIKKLERRWK